ncbi:MAG: hypothetical protein WBF93_09990 [Pirellulales bacterium]
MHEVTFLAEALSAIRRLGYEIREECVGGNGGGICVLHGQKFFFLDPSLDLADQLDLACDALRNDVGVYSLVMPDRLREALGIRRSA